KNGNPVNDNGTPTADTTKLDDKGKPLGNNDKNDDDPTVTVLPKDKEPVAKDDDATTKEATPVTGDVTGNDTLGDGEKGDHTFAKATDPLNGTVTVNEDGTYEYTPKAGFTGKDSFEYTITDKDGDTSTAKVVITVDPKTPPTDKEPVAKDDTNKTTEGTPIPGDVTTNDELGDGDKGEHTFSKASDPLNGTVTVNPDGTYKYTPKAGFTGKDSFEYTITDKDGDTSTATVVITVDPKPVPVPVKVSLEGNNTVIEGDGKTLDFTAKLNKASTVDTLVKVKLDPTATNTVEPKDITKITYTDANGQPKEIMDKDEIKAIIEGTKTLDVTIKAGQTESPIKLEVADDEIYEKSEEIHFTIDSVENAVSAEIDTAKDKAQGTIKDESDNPNTPLDGSNTEGDKPTVSIAVDPDKAVAIEGEQPLLVFNVSQDNVSEVDTTVQVKFDPAKTEIKANDIASIVYENSTGKVVTISDKTMIENILNGTTAIDVKIPAGEKNAPAIMFIAADDEVYEGSEDVVLKIESADNANVDTTPAKGVVNDESNNPQNPGDGSNTLGDYQDPDDSATTPQDQTIDKPATEGLLKDDSEVDPDVELAVSNVQVNGTNVPIDTETPVMKNGKEIGTLTVKEDGSYIFDPAPDFAGDVPEVTYDIVDKNDNNKVLDSSKLDITVIPKDPTKVQVSIEGDNTVIEGDGKTLDFNVKLDKPSTKDTLVDVKVDLAKTNVEPKDITKITYTDETGQPKEIKDPAKIKAIIEGTEVLTINMKPGAEKTPIKLTVADDEVYEQSEDISLTISQATNDDGVTIGTNTAKGTIDDESSNRNDPLDKTDKEGDKPIVNISVDPDTVIEGDKQSLVFKVAYDQGQTSEKDSIVHVQPKKLADNVEADDIESITYENVNGEIITLTDPAKIKDFFDNGVDVKIPAGKDHAPVISILPKDDDVFEQSEPLTLAITEPTKDATAEQKEYTIGTNNEATGTVDDESTNPDNPLDKSNKDGDKPTVNIKATVDTATEPDPADPDATNQDLVFEVSYNKGQLSTEDSIVNVKPHDEDSVSPADIASVTYTKPDGTVETLDTKDEIQKFFDEGVNVKIAKGDDKAPTITVTAKDDNVYEVSEDLQLDISAPANVPATDKQYNLGVDNATGTINDEDNVSEPPAKDKHGDLPGVGIYATDNKAIEGVAGDVLVYEVRYQNGQTSTKDSIVHVRPFALSEAQVPDIAEITYTPAGSTETKTISNPDKILAFAKQGLDVTIPAGSDKAPVITITPKQDNVYEISEFLQLNIAKPVDANSENLEYQVIKPTARGTIYDEPDANNQGDKPQVSITIDPTQVNEGANTPLVYKVAYDNGKVSKFDSIVHVKPTLNGGDGKVAVEDIASIIYTDKDGNQQIVSDPVKIKEIFDNGIDVKIAEGKSEAPVISVLPKDDAKDEVTEILTLKITQPTDTAVTDAQKDYDIGTPTATGEILDNDVSIDITQIGDNVQPTGDVAGAEHNNENTYGTVDFKETPISGVTKAAVGSTVTITLSDGTTEITREVTVKAGTNGENTWDTGDNPFTADEMKTLQLNSSTDLIVKASVTENGTTITDTDKSELVHTRVIVDNPQSVVEGTDIINHIRLETAVAKETTLEVDFYSTAIDPKVQAVPGYDFGNTKYHLPWEADGVWHTLYGNTNPAGNLRIKVPAGETGPILLKMNTFADGQQELTETYRVKVKAINNPEYFVSDGDKSDAVVDTIFDSPAITVDNTDANVSGGDNSVVEGTGEVAKGNITVTNPQSVQALTMTDKNGAKVDVTTATAQNPVTIEGSQGTLKITGYNKTTGLMTYEFVQKPVEKEQHKNGKGPDDDSVKDSFAIELTSSAGTKINDSLDIVILDTAPVAKDDEDKVVEDIAPIARGNVVTGQGTTNAGNGQSTDDTNVDNGADGANGWVTGVKLGGDTSAPVTGAVATKISGEYGDLIMLADGRYQYKLYETPNPNDYTDPENSTQYQQLLAKSQKVHALLPTDKAEDVFTYTITDSDGDTSTATLKIDVKGIDDRTKMLTKTARVSEEGLTHGIADTTANGRPESPTNPANPTLDKTDSTVSTGQVIVIDPDTDFSQAQLSFTNLPNYLSTNGDKIAWKAYNATTNDYSTTGNDWVGYVDANGNGQVDAGEKAIIKLDIDDTPPTLAHTVDGAKSYVFKYKATLVNNIDHSVWKNPQDNNQEYWEDIEHLYVNPVLTYTQNGKAKSDVFKQQQVLVIEDDAPVGKEIVHNVDIPVDTIDISNLKTGFSHSEFTSLAYDKNRLHTSDIVATEYQDSKTYTQTINGKTYTQERKDEFDHKDHPDVWDEGLYWGLPTGSAKAKPSGYETLENPEYQSKDGKNVEDYAKSFDLGTFRHDNFQNAAYKDGTSSVLNNTDLNLEFDVTINGKTETVHEIFKMYHFETGNLSKEQSEIAANKAKIEKTKKYLPKLFDGVNDDDIGAYIEADFVAISGAKREVLIGGSRYSLSVELVNDNKNLRNIDVDSDSNVRFLKGFAGLLDNPETADENDKYEGFAGDIKTNKDDIATILNDKNINIANSVENASNGYRVVAKLTPLEPPAAIEQNAVAAGKVQFGGDSSENVDILWTKSADNKYAYTEEVTANGDRIFTTKYGKFIGNKDGSYSFKAAEDIRLQLDLKKDEELKYEFEYIDEDGDRVTNKIIIKLNDYQVMATTGKTEDFADIDDFVVLDGTINDDTLGGSQSNDLIRGDAGNDTLTGNGGNDFIKGGLGADKNYGGDGDDTIVFDPDDIMSDGGEGTDTLRVSGSPVAPFDTDKITSIEVIDMDNKVIQADGTTVPGKDTLYLSGSDIPGFNTDKVLTVEGNTGDVLILNGMKKSDTSDKNGYDLYTDKDGNKLYVDKDIAVNSRKNPVGTDQADTPALTDNADYFDGKAGDDSIDGKGGKDMLLGGAGNDTIYGGADTDEIHGGEGNDTIFGGAKGVDPLNDDVADDVIYGDGGSDTIKSGKGNDTVYGGDGNDKIWGYAGDDRLEGGAGNDSIYGHTGNDKIYGGDGDDTQLNGGAGNDRIYGDAGEDLIKGEAGDDQLFGGADNDTVRGGTGNDELHGNEGDDTLEGGDGFDVIYGDAGNDILKGGAGQDKLLGGTGNDVIHYDGTDDGIGTTDGGKGIDTIKVQSGTPNNANNGNRITLQNASKYEIVDLTNGTKETFHLTTDDMLNANSSKIVIINRDLGANKDGVYMGDGSFTDVTKQATSAIDGYAEYRLNADPTAKVFLQTDAAKTVTADSPVVQQLLAAEKSYDPSAEDNTVGYSNDVEFTHTDTGAGYDTLMFNPADDVSLNFNSISAITKNIEAIDMEDNSTIGDSITISASDVLVMTDEDNELFIKGDSNDTVELAGLTQTTGMADDVAGYDKYTNTNGATVYIDEDITNISLI
ncbi:MAG: tandem-95 repeat protein, partial [Gammaproteobacteria bacterium]|nr:tandem-95 repeat protein [Gammaproteobacteria bacterium]